MSSPIKLVVNGEEYTDWITGSFRFSLDEGASQASVTVSERWQSAFKNYFPWRIPAQSEVQVYVSNELALDGYITSHTPSINESDHTVGLEVRSKSIDLVQCSIIHDTYRWSNKTPLEIAIDICTPLGVSVETDLTLSALPSFQVDAGAKPWDVLVKLSERAGFLVVPNVGGGISLTRIADDLNPIALGAYISATAPNNFEGRFSDWIIKGQKQRFSDTDVIGAAQVSGEVQDTAVARYRPMSVLASGAIDGVSAADMAAWNMKRSIGQSLSATVSVTGFKRVDGRIWWPNTMVYVDKPELNIVRNMIVSAVDFSLDQGETTTLTLKHPAAYTPQPQPAATTRITKRKSLGQTVQETGSATVNYYDSADVSASSIQPILLD